MTNKLFGVLGDGQLALMMAEAAQSMGLTVTALGKNKPGVLRKSFNHILGDYTTVSGVKEFGAQCHTMTIELEGVSVEGVGYVERSGINVRPSYGVLRQMVDKYTQKQFVSKLGIRTANNVVCGDRHDITEFGKLYGFPIVAKKRHGSYDGYGNTVIRRVNEIDEAIRTMGGLENIYFESFIPFTRELAVVLTRGADGEYVVYPVVETSQQGGPLPGGRIQPDGICHYVTGPVPGNNVTWEAVDRAVQIAEALSYVGTMAVEYLETADGELFFNEFAPRVHNSGHWTQDAAVPSQFENHIRACMGWPLAKVPAKVLPFAMVNILGRRQSDIFELPPGVSEALAYENVFFHWYGKTPNYGRKLGHINVVGTEERHEVAMLLATGQLARDAIRV